MKFVSFEKGGSERVGIVKEEHIIDLTSFTDDMLGLIEQIGQDSSSLATWADSAETSIPLVEATLLAPIPRPRRNIICLGLNYAEHAAEHYSASGRETQLPKHAIVFTKATTSINGPFSAIPYDSKVTTELDWEVELAVIIGRAGKNIPTNQANDHVFGYTILNDVSARDLQRKHKQYFKGKSLDGACPMGPWIVTADEIDDPHNLRVITRVNGQVKQDSNTEFMIFDIPEIIRQLSIGMTLIPGDIIATGTPSGVGFARQPPEFLQPGDVVECEIEKIGKIRNQIVDQNSN